VVGSKLQPLIESYLGCRNVSLDNSPRMSIFSASFCDRFLTISMATYQSIEGSYSSNFVGRLPRYLGPPSTFGTHCRASYLAKRRPTLSLSPLNLRPNLFTLYKVIRTTRIEVHKQDLLPPEPHIFILPSKILRLLRSSRYLPNK
jgi:hypothetical protein